MGELLLRLQIDVIFMGAVERGIHSSPSAGGWCSVWIASTSHHYSTPILGLFCVGLLSGLQYFRPLLYERSGLNFLSIQADLVTCQRSQVRQTFAHLYLVLLGWQFKC